MYEKEFFSLPPPARPPSTPPPPQRRGFSSTRSSQPEPLLSSPGKTSDDAKTPSGRSVGRKGGEEERLRGWLGLLSSLLLLCRLLLLLRLMPTFFPFLLLLSALGAPRRCAEKKRGREEGREEAPHSAAVCISHKRGNFVSVVFPLLSPSRAASSI